MLVIPCHIQGQMSIYQDQKWKKITNTASNKQLFNVILIGDSICVITLIIKGHLQI